MRGKAREGVASVQWHMLLTVYLECGGLMMFAKRAVLLLCMSLIVLAILGHSKANAQQPSLPSYAPVGTVALGHQHFEGTSRTAAGGPGLFFLDIKEWSTLAEIQALAVSRKGGLNENLLHQMAAMPAKGFCSYGNDHGINVQVTYSMMLPSGERLVEALSERDYPLVGNPSAGLMYCPFTLIYLRLDTKGNGSGQVLLAPGVRFRSDGYIELGPKTYWKYDLLGVETKQVK